MTRDPIPLVPLTRAEIEPAVRAALAEDLGSDGDVTSRAVLPENARAEAALCAREEGVVAGIDIAMAAFTLVDKSLEITPRVQDGTGIQAGAVLLETGGPAASILAAERVALNFVQHLCGIATAARQIVEAIAGRPTRLLCTRKTTPNLRLFEKYAVRAGGGCNHRFGLYDAILIKDNHLAALGGDVGKALHHAREAAGNRLTVQIEVDSLEQLDAVLASGLADSVLLDNFDLADLATAVKRCSGRLVTEASGRISPTNAAAVADTGVDYLSSGWITHSAPALDLGLDFAATPS